MRTVSAAALAVFSSPDVKPVVFIEMLFDNDTLRFWTGRGAQQWGETVGSSGDFGPDFSTDFSLGIAVDPATLWTGAGHLLDVQPIEEGSEVSAPGTSISLSGVDSEIIALALNEPIEGRRINFYITGYDAGVIVSDTVARISGRMDVPTISDDGTSGTVAITVEDRFIDANRPRICRYTDEDHRRREPGDKGFAFVAKLQDRELQWGPK
jgi:hypothetical protein